MGVEVYEKTAYSDICDTNYDEDWLSKAAKVREVTIKKDPKTPFGALFAPIGKYLYVVRVDKYALLKLSAAYRAGIKFGDRLNTVNGTSVDSSTDIEKLHANLKNAQVVSFELDERPVIAKYAETEGHELFGIEFADQNGFGHISEVKPGSVCARAGFRVGDIIIKVNEECVLYLHDIDIYRIVKQHRQASRRLSIMAIRGPLAAQLKIGCEYFMAQLGIKNLPAHIFINQTLHLDAEEQHHLPLPAPKEKPHKFSSFMHSHSSNASTLSLQVPTGRGGVVSAPCSAPASPTLPRRKVFHNRSVSTPASPVLSRSVLRRNNGGSDSARPSINNMLNNARARLEGTGSASYTPCTDISISPIMSGSESEDDSIPDKTSPDGKTTGNDSGSYESPGQSVHPRNLFSFHRAFAM